MLFIFNSEYTQREKFVVRLVLCIKMQSHSRGWLLDRIFVIQMLCSREITFDMFVASGFAKRVAKIFVERV